MHRLSTAILFGCVITCMGLGAPAAEIAHDKNTRNSIANFFNHNQLSKIQPEQISRAAVDISTQESDADAVEIGILFFRGDGGDPNELRVDNDMLIYITGRTGEGHTYQNGTEVRINPVVKESARQIAMQQFVALAGEKLLAKELPATAQEAITLFVEGRANLTASQAKWRPSTCGDFREKQPMLQPPKGRVIAGFLQFVTQSY